MDSSLYEKQIKCPVCTKDFNVTKVKAKTSKMLKRDSDLCVHYEGINPIVYDVWVCQNCGYSAQGDKFEQISTKDASYQQIMDRFINLDKMDNVLRHYSINLENPWLSYYNSKDDVYNKVWYEDSQSVQAKINLAKMFGIHGISLWRLGNIPSFNDAKGKSSFLDVWQQIQKNVKIK